MSITPEAPFEPASGREQLHGLGSNRRLRRGESAAILPSAGAHRAVGLRGHSRYDEPFAGSAALYLHVERPVATSRTPPPT
jgi:hypothetical protein